MPFSSQFRRFGCANQWLQQNPHPCAQGEYDEKRNGIIKANEHIFNEVLNKTWEERKAIKEKARKDEKDIEELKIELDLAYKKDCFIETVFFCFHTNKFLYICTFGLLLTFNFVLVASIVILCAQQIYKIA